MKPAKAKVPEPTPTFDNFDELVELARSGKLVTSTLDVLVQRKDDIIMLLSRNVTGKMIYNSLKAGGMLKCSYAAFQFSLRRFSIMFDLPVRGDLTKEERVAAQSAVARYAAGEALTAAKQSPKKPIPQKEKANSVNFSVLRKDDATDELKRDL